MSDPSLSLVSCAQDLRGGLAQVRASGLYDQGAPDSHIEEILRQVEADGLVSREREVTDVWLIRDRAHPVGVAMVSLEQQQEREPPRAVLNVFVAFSHRRQGLGQQLVQVALAQHPSLEGHYTRDVIRLYQQHHIPDVYRHRLPDGAAGKRMLQQRHAAMMTPDPAALSAAPSWLFETEAVPFTRANQRSQRQAHRRRGR